MTKQAVLQGKARGPVLHEHLTASHLHAGLEVLLHLIHGGFVLHNPPECNLTREISCFCAGKGFL